MAMTLLETNPDSTDVTTIDFTSGIDSTYRLYIFKFININPATDAAELSFQFNVDGGADYDETLTTAGFRGYHWEDESSFGIGDVASYNQAEGTAFQLLTEEQGNEADESLSGEMYLFNPSSTTYVTHFITRTSTYVASGGGGVQDDFFAGYVNNTAAVTDVQFKMSSGNFDGTIKLYGVG